MDHIDQDVPVVDDDAMPDDLPSDEPSRSADLPLRNAGARDVPHLLRKIPVTLTLEVGSARISLQELMALDGNSVVALDTLAGEPLVIKVNGTPIGHAEVGVSGEQYALKVLDLDGLHPDLWQK